VTAVKRSLRALRSRLVALNQRAGVRLGLKLVDLDVLDLIGQHGPMTPSAVARETGIHPATLTGILDRLERDGWVARERVPTQRDRRAVQIRALTGRARELAGTLAGMNRRMDAICADYTADELNLIEGFLRRTAEAGSAAAAELTQR